MPSANQPVALLLAPAHQVHEQRLHHAVGRLAAIAHQIHRQLARAPAPATGSRTPRSVPRARRRRPESARRSRRRRSRARSPSPLPPCVASQSSDTSRSSSHDGRHLGGAEHPERRAVVLEPPHRLAVAACARAAFERELRQVDRGLFAELDERQPEVGVVVQLLLPDLVEHGHAAEVVAAFEEQANQARAAHPAGRPDRRAPPTSVPGRRT